MIILVFILLIICALIYIFLNVYNCHITGGNKFKYKKKIHSNIDANIDSDSNANSNKLWQKNVEMAKELLEDEFKDLYNENEKSIILNICKKELDCNIWNDLIDFSNIDSGNQYYYSRAYDRIKPYYPESFLLIHCYFRKFFINRLQVLTRFYKPNSVILYIGAANSVFLPILIDLFPSYVWHIYEELALSYEINHSANVFIYKKKMDLEESNKYIDKIDVFISDFRRPIQSTTISLKKEEIPLQERINKMMLEDVMFNIEIMRNIKPKMGAGIKFKSPQVEPSSSQNIEIPRGKILWLPWSQSTSTDGTLVIESNEIRHNTNMTIYLSILQNAYAMHNRYYRPWGYYKISPNYNKKDHKINGFCNCFDCVCEFITVSNYTKLNINSDITVSNLMNQFSYKLEPLVSIINKMNYHGRYPKLLPAVRMKTISAVQNIGKYANIDIYQKREFLKRLKDYANKYDEFALEDANNEHNHANNEHSHGHKHKFNTDITHNLKTATQLLNTKFKKVYNKEEEKIILNISSKISKFSSIWNDLKNVMIYRGDKDKLAHNYVYCHLGQRKLFMAELQLLTRFLPDVNNKAIIVYVGAAAGFHLPLLFKLFPNTIWHLYDPAPFCNKLIEMNSSHAEKKVFLYNEFFTDETANKWRNKCDLFISDIRLSADTRSTFEAQVEYDMRMQEKWTIIINPKLGASLKFRPPYLDPNIKHQSHKYIRGQILWQMWPPKNSTECRLIIDAIDIHNGSYENNIKDDSYDYNTMEFDVVKYQNSCAYHNIIERAWATYELPKDCNGRICEELNKVVGYDRCFDCTCEATSWLQYQKLKNAKKQDINKCFDELTNITHQSLLNKKSLHGHNQYYMAADRLNKIH